MIVNPQGGWKVHISLGWRTNAEGRIKVNVKFEWRFDTNRFNARE